MPHRTIGAALTLTMLAVDQVSKVLAQRFLGEAPVELTPFLDLRLGFNSGITFGLFAGAGDPGRWALIAATGAVALWLLMWMWREVRLAIAAPLALICGGALGNILDRLRSGAVTDFIDAHIGNAHWPTFNLADSAIVAGTCALILASLYSSPGQRAAGGDLPIRTAPARGDTLMSEAEKKRR